MLLGTIGLFRFLGAMNTGFIALALLAAALPTAGTVAFIVLAIANASQAIIDLRVQRQGLAHGPMFQQVFVGEVFFTRANFVTFGREST